MKLVIVESPTKCNTIQRYLGNDYLVKASLGHIRDLATSGKGGLGIDIEKGFDPTYKINKDKINVVNELVDLSKKSDEVILATDPDREGEAIAWHLAKVLKLDESKNKRLEFHEITRESITAAMAHPRTIDLNLVSSQETRRILDRIIGFKLSSLLYSKIHSKSAGRVQSASLKLIYDHDQEIKAFVSEEYWNILVKAMFHGTEYSLDFKGINGEKVDIHTKEESDKILEGIPEKLEVSNVTKAFKSTESKLPFTTSTMQQEAFTKLRFNTKKTSFVAQTLYEGLNINGEHVGLITYMRTDSTRLSATFIDAASDYISVNFGADYLGNLKRYQKDAHSQDAHEAIRPTSIHRSPESVRKYLKPDQYSLYKLIYNRAVASLMKPKKEEILTISLIGNQNNFEMRFNKTVFPGYEVILKDEDEEYRGAFPEINIGDEFVISEKIAEQKFTQPPQNYSEAKLVKLMEEVGIGRPSTYASTIETLKKRAYIKDEAGILTITDQGIKTIAVLKKYFPEIVDVKYTADMEKKLDRVQDGSSSRVHMLSNFYVPFNQEVEDAKVAMYKDEVVEVGELCPICGAPLVIKEGRNGKFIGCSNYPKCHYVKKEPKKDVVYTGRTCPECGKPLVERTDKKGNKFIACSGYPTCRYIEQNNEYKESDYVKPCPKCGGFLVKKKGKYGSFLGCTNYPTCNYMEKIIRRKYKAKSL